MYGWMKFVETAPERYDWAVKVMTGGNLDRIKDSIAETIKPGDEVLDIGCGTGTLALRCLKMGARVTCLDSSKFMLEQAEKNAKAAGFEGSLRLVQASVTQLGKYFADEKFDVVMSTLSFGEFPRDYLDYILRDCRRILRPQGRLLVADEVWPEKFIPLCLYGIGLSIFWIPQFLLLRRAFFPIKDLRGIVEAGGFEVRKTKTWAATSFQLLFAEKTAVKHASAHEMEASERLVAD